MNFLRKFSKPITQHPVFLTWMFMLLGFHLLQELHGEVALGEFKYLRRTLGSIAFCLFESWMLTWLVALCKRKWAKIAIYVFALSISIIYLFLKFNFGTSFSPQIMILVAETNGNESAEFLRTFLPQTGTLKSVALIAAFAIAIILTERANTKISNILQKHRFGTVIVVLFGAVILYGAIFGAYAYFRMFSAKNVNELESLTLAVRPTDHITEIIYSTLCPLRSGDETKSVEKFTIAASKESATCSAADANDSLAVVMVIGESYIRSHAQIYGYNLPTTPNMTAEMQSGRLYKFDDVVAPYNTTSVSLKNALSCNSIADGEHWYERPLFPSIIKAAGFSVWFWDAQWNCGKGESVFDFSLNSAIHGKNIAPYCYNHVNDTTPQYDLQLIEDFSAHHKPQNLEFVIFHLMGQHYYARARYPKQIAENWFHASDISRSESWVTDSKRQDIAEYDNATRYNDLVLKSIFDLYADRNAVVVYFADHGEEVYDIRDFRGRDHNMTKSKAVLEYQNGIPFIIWCSDKYIATHPEQVDAIKQAQRKPFMIDNVCQIIFYLAHVQTRHYQSERNPLSSDYKSSHRIVNGNADYDAIK